MNYPQRFALNDKVDIVLDTYKGRCLEATSLILFEDSLLWTEKALVSSNIDQDDNNMINEMSIDYVVMEIRSWKYMDGLLA